MAAGAALVADADDPSAAATLEKFRLYETRAVSATTIALARLSIDWGIRALNQRMGCRGST